MRAIRKLFAFRLGGVFTAAAVPFVVVAAYFFFSALNYYRTHPRRIGEPLYQGDPVLGFALKPHVKLPGRQHSLYTDARGVRISEHGHVIKNPRVLAVGCSFTFGLGVPHEQSFPAQLGERLGQSVYNLGVNGYSTLTATLRAGRFLDLKPKVVVYGLIEDHFYRNVLPCARAVGSLCRPAPYLVKNNGTFEVSFLQNEDALSFQHTAEIELDHGFGWRDIYWAAMRDWLRLTGKDAHGLTKAAQNGKSREFFAEAMKFQLGKFQKLAAERGFELVVLHIPDPMAPAPLTTEFKGAVEAHIGKPRFHFVDATKRFQQYLAEYGVPEGALCVTSGDCHPGRVAHELLAEELLPVVKRFLK